MPPRRPSRLPLFLGLSVLLFAGCGEGSPRDGHKHDQKISVEKTYSGDYPINVVCTTGMVADLVRNIGGERVKVTQLMGEGVDPHQYKSSPGDVNRLSRADVIFYSGLHLEGKMAVIFDRLSGRKPAFAVTEYIPRNKLLADSGGTLDPHLWFDVSLWRESATVVRDALSAFDPKHAQEYNQRDESYQADLAKLHEYAREQIATIPKERRVLVTAHDAFRYFGRAYDIEVKGIQGISTESEASVKDINALVDFLVAKKVKAVFVESSVANRNVKSLLEGCAVKGHAVVIGGELFSDAMGKEGTPAGTYPGMVRHNVDTIVKALR